MLDIKFIRENPNKVKEACQKKQVRVDIDKLLELDKELRRLKKIQEDINAIKNRATETIKIVTPSEKSTVIKDTVTKVADYLENTPGISEKNIGREIDESKEELNDLLLLVPNMPFDDVPIGKDESQNVVLREIGKRPKFKFKPKNYLEISQKLDLIDTQRAAKVSGSRFGYLKNEAALFEFALINFGLDVLTKEGFSPIIPPVMLKPEMARGTGYFEATDLEEAYFISQDNLYLIGTSEQSLIAMHADEILDEKDLPKRYVAFSTCFRREAGSYGKDTKGILRVHQFDKLEMVSFCHPEKSKEEHKYLLSLEEKVMKSLKLPYRVANICTGDLGRPAAAKYDIEAWIPSEGRYRETHSTSNCTDFQARRLNIRYRDKRGKLNFVHTLNGTAFSQRPIIAILENYQRKDGSVIIPAVLQKYLNFKVINGRKNNSNQRT